MGECQFLPEAKDFGVSLTEKDMKLANEAFNDDILGFVRVCGDEYKKMFKTSSLEMLHDLKSQGWNLDITVNPIIDNQGNRQSVIDGKLCVFVMFVAYDGFRVHAVGEDINPDTAVKQAFDQVSQKGETVEECRKRVNQNCSNYNIHVR